MFYKSIAFTFFAISLAFFTTSSLSAQSDRPHREVGLQFSSFDFDGGGGFSAFYKKQKKENVYRRIRLLFGNISVGATEEDFTFNFVAGVNIGREKRKSLDSKLEFYQGPEFSLRLAIASVIDDDVRALLTPGFGWVFGLQHSLNERWAVNLETVPSLAISTNINGDAGPDALAIDARVSNTVSLGLVRKF